MGPTGFGGQSGMVGPAGMGGPGVGQQGMGQPLMAGGSGGGCGSGVLMVGQQGMGLTPGMIPSIGPSGMGSALGCPPGLGQNTMPSQLHGKNKSDIRFMSSIEPETTVISRVKVLELIQQLDPICFIDTEAEDVGFKP
eukprot:TRINITY_DN11452_c0_g2_i1.p1 TRINITY_DN11452_c0_g2~~TRINITY_DN11452_c0_g2_i1.p1  ORF type:complete len:161 (+),score=40.87 TRINITY_DN11452_c0_g2_i1:72-485(+)